MNDTKKNVWKRLAWEFVPPLLVALLWILISLWTGFSKEAQWVVAIRDFTVTFFMFSWLWNQYNRVEHQTTTKEANEKLRNEVGVLKGILEATQVKIDALKLQPATAQSPQFIEISDLVRSANNHVDVISAVSNATIGEFKSVASVTTHSNT